MLKHQAWACQVAVAPNPQPILGWLQSVLLLQTSNNHYSPVYTANFGRP